MERELYYVPYSYPRYERNQARVIAHTRNGRRCRAMFYWNGTKPTFASYGSDITESVTCWEYDYDFYKKYNKEIPRH